MKQQTRPPRSSVRVAVAVLALACVGPALATDYHVRMDGSDSSCDGLADVAAGSGGCAWRTIQRCADTVRAGDTCFIAEGNYVENPVLAGGGLPGQPITFQGAGADFTCDHDWNPTTGTWQKCTSPAGATTIQPVSGWCFDLVDANDHVILKDIRCEAPIRAVDVDFFELHDSIVVDTGGGHVIDFLRSDNAVFSGNVMWNDSCYGNEDCGTGPGVDQSDTHLWQDNVTHNFRNGADFFQSSHLTFRNHTQYNSFNHAFIIEGADYVDIDGWTAYKTQNPAFPVTGGGCIDFYCSDNVTIRNFTCVGNSDQNTEWIISGIKHNSGWPSKVTKVCKGKPDIDGDDGFHCWGGDNAGAACSDSDPADDMINGNIYGDGTECSGGGLCVNDKYRFNNWKIYNATVYNPTTGGARCFQGTRTNSSVNEISLETRWETMEWDYNNCYDPEKDLDGDGIMEDDASPQECLGRSTGTQAWFVEDIDGDGCFGDLDDWQAWRCHGTPDCGVQRGLHSMERDPMLTHPRGNAPFDFTPLAGSPLVDAGNPDIDLDGVIERPTCSLSIDVPCRGDADCPGAETCDIDTFSCPSLGLGAGPEGDDCCTAANRCAGLAPDIGSIEVGLVGGPAPSACSNGIDDDGDGLTDYPNDPGCSSPADTNEHGTLQCDDGLDNDGDGNIDLADVDCMDPTGDREGPLPTCSDGADNDGDGAMDFPADFGCSSATDGSELGTSQCGDGIDNDGDGALDQDDAGCTGAADDDETQPVTGSGIDCTEAAFEAALATCQDGDTITFNCSNTTIFLSSARDSTRVVLCDNVTIDGGTQNIVFEMSPPWWDDVATACAGSNCDADNDGVPESCADVEGAAWFLKLAGAGATVQNLAFNFFWEGIHLAGNRGSLINVSCDNPGDDCASNFGSSTSGAGTGHLIQNSVFTNACDKAVQLYGNELAGSTALDLTLRDSRFTNTATPVRGSPSVPGRFWLENNIFEEITPPLAIYGCTGPRFDGIGTVVLWKDNVVDGCRRGLRMQGTSQLLSLGGNVFRNNDLRGALFADSAKGLIEGDVFLNNGGSSSSETGFGGLAITGLATVDAGGGGQINLDGSLRSSTGGNTFSANSGPTDATLDLHNAASGVVKAECNEWGDADPSDQVSGIVDWDPIGPCVVGSPPDPPPATPQNLRRTDTR